MVAIMACLSFVSCKKELADNKPSAIETASGKADMSHGMTAEGVPSKGSYTTTFMTVQPPPMFIQNVTGTGIASHLGQSTFEAVSHVTVTKQPPFVVTGTRTLTAANGDQIFTTFSGTSTPVAPGINNTQLHDIIIGGTGRVKNASGSFDAFAVANQQTATYTADFEGYIKY